LNLAAAIVQALKNQDRPKACLPMACPFPDRGHVN
jgi:hypothetical protein